MKFSIPTGIKKALNITGISVVALVAILFLAPYFFPEAISNKIKDVAKSRVKGELNFSSARFSFFSHFPNLTLNLNDFVLKGSAPFQNDTLISAKQVSLGVSLRTLFSSTVRIDQIFLKQSFINIEVNPKGEANYNVYISSPQTPQSNADSGSASLKIERIVVEKSHLVYDDQTLPMHIDAGGFDYEGKGDFSKSIFDLTSQVKIRAIDFLYDKQGYFISKTLSANLVTKINTNSLEFLFEKNDLFINQLPLGFKGRFAFLKNGFAMDFNVLSKETELKNFISAFPPAFLTWLEKTDVKGSIDFKASLSGNYIAQTKTMPSFNMNMAIRNGYISNNKTPTPVKNLFLNFETKIPGFNMDSLYVNVDSIYANVGTDYISAIYLMKGLNNPEIHAKINGELNLEKWQNAMGLPGLEAKGQLSFHGKADGVYMKGQNPKNFRPDTVIASIPIFQLNAVFRNGYFKYPSLPKSVEKVSFDVAANCADSNYKNASLVITNINAALANNYLKGFMKFSGADDFPMDINLNGLLNLGDIKQFYPIDSLEIKGKVAMTIQTKGKYNAAKKLFPITNANFKMEDGFIQTKYYPHPIEKIAVDATIQCISTSTKDVSVAIKPIGFVFEGQPFTVKADMKNLENIKYDITSKGTMDIGKIYQVFSRKGIEVSGLVKTDLELRGLQSDAVAGLYQKLHNAGTLSVKDISVKTNYYPHPFFINTGVFRFKDDKIWFESFKGTYLQSDYELSGYLNNTFNYALKDQPLHGQFDLKSNLLVADDFMAFSGDTTQASTTGVFIVPENLDLNFKAAVKTVKYKGMDINDAKGDMQLKQSVMTLSNTGFNLIGAPVLMNATYKSLSAMRAEFSYHINAKEFNIKKAYNEIKLFHDMASAAASADGIVSLDYNLKGKLNGNMYPIYPSLEGGGVLSVKAVKMKGFKLFSAAGKAAGKDSLTGNADISKVDIKTTIKNNVIHIEQTKIRVFPFRLKFSGQANFDGQMNLKFRIGLPPLGIFGIPMNITGTQDKPIIKMGRGDNATLKETEDTDN
ncbi:MAG: AsmA family protein [Bacteroidota bacterium]